MLDTRDGGTKLNFIIRSEVVTSSLQEISKKLQNPPSLQKFFALKKSKNSQNIISKYLNSANHSLH